MIDGSSSISLSPGSPSIVAPRSVSRQLAGARAFHTARRLYFLGCATSGIAILRPLGLTFSDWIFGAAILAAVVELLLARRLRGEALPKGIPAGIVVGVSAFAAGTLLSSIVYGDILQAIPTVLRVTYLALPWLWLSIAVLRRSDDVGTSLKLWVFTVTLSSTVAVAQLTLGDILPASMTGSQPNGRMTGLSRHQNDLAASIAIAAAPLLAVMTELTIKWRDRILALAAVCISFAGLILTGSIGGLMSAAASVLVWLVLSDRVRIRTAATLILLPFILQGAVTLQRMWGVQSPLDRLAEEVFPDKGTGTYDLRAEAAQEVWDRIQENPLLGRGLGVEGMRVANGDIVHNLFLAVWVDAGALGLAGFVLIFLSIAKLALRMHARVVGRSSRSLASALTASIVGALVFALGAPILWQRFFWMPFGLLVALGSSVEASKRISPSIR